MLFYILLTFERINFKLIFYFLPDELQSEKQSQNYYPRITITDVDTVMEDESTSERADLTTRVVQRVAKKEGLNATDLSKPLDEVVDPDALEALFSESPDGYQRAAGTIQFTYQGYTIVIDSDQQVSIEESMD